MATQEFYIRAATETEARGPFTLEQLVSLADAGQVSGETLYYEAATEEWRTIDSNLTVKAALFPEKKKLRVKPKEGIKSLNTADESAAPVTVNDMLAAAEGKTHDTKDKISSIITYERAARIGMWTLIVLLMISAGALILSTPSIDLLISMKFSELFRQPFAILAAVDLFLSILLILQLVTIYPLIRLRAALGLGFIGFILWSQGEVKTLIALAFGSAGMYLCTIFVSYFPLGLAILAGLLGMTGFAYFMLT